MQGKKINWDCFFLNLAKQLAEASKDPSTKVGAVIIDKHRRVISCGYNGFPRGVLDYPDRYENREIKYQLVVHAEANAIVFAKQDLTDCTLYTYPLLPCSRCAGLVIQSGINRCVSLKLTDEQNQRWGESINLSKTMFEEAGVTFEEIEWE